jgi:hypothetical protein
VLARVLGRWARFGLFLMGAAIIVWGFAIEQVLLVIFGVLALVLNLRPRTIDPGLSPMSRLGVSISAFGFMSVLAAYAVLIRHFMSFT